MAVRRIMLAGGTLLGSAVISVLPSGGRAQAISGCITPAPNGPSAVYSYCSSGSGAHRGNYTCSNSSGLKYSEWKPAGVRSYGSCGSGTVQSAVTDTLAGK